MAELLIHKDDRDRDVYEIKDVKIKYKDFGGRFDGKKSIKIEVDRDMGERLIEEGFDLSIVPNPDGDPITMLLKIKVNYPEQYPSLHPKIYVATGNTINMIGQEEVGTLDGMTLMNINIEFNKYHWSYAGKQGLGASLRRLWADQYIDEYEMRYLKFKEQQETQHRATDLMEDDIKF